MTESGEYEGLVPAWCPGCGNFGILKAFKQAVSEMGLAPHEFIVVSGIGQAGKFPHYTRCHTFNGLHGRTLPVATGIKLTNHHMPVIAVAGDGDCYGEGGNHLLHTIRRNLDVTLFVHNNQVYGLTKGQASPTTLPGTKTKIEPYGVPAEPLNPIALAVSLDCSFVARGYAGDTDHLKELMKEAINHRGFALLDILQPCVTYNKINTYQWFKQRVYHLESSYDPADRDHAFEKAHEPGDRISLGVIYKRERAVLHEKLPMIHDRPLVEQPFDVSRFKEIMKDFY